MAEVEDCEFVPVHHHQKSAFPIMMFSSLKNSETALQEAAGSI